jgi:hypothetical protein
MRDVRRGPPSSERSRPFYPMAEGPVNSLPPGAFIRARRGLKSQGSVLRLSAGPAFAATIVGSKTEVRG